MKTTITFKDKLGRVWVVSKLELRVGDYIKDSDWLGVATLKAKGKKGGRWENVQIDTDTVDEETIELVIGDLYELANKIPYGDWEELKQEDLDD